MTSQLVGRLLVVSHDAGIPPEEEWSEVLGVLAKHNLEQLRVLVFTDGGGPSPAQQVRLAKAVSRWSRTLLVAVVSDNIGIRFLASTLAFFLNRIRTFSRAELADACRYLALTPQECELAEKLAVRPSSPRSSREIL